LVSLEAKNQGERGQKGRRAMNRNIIIAVVVVVVIVIIYYLYAGGHLSGII
jgi:hypothetical protein